MIIGWWKHSWTHKRTCKGDANALPSAVLQTLRSGVELAFTASSRAPRLRFYPILFAVLFTAVLFANARAQLAPPSFVTHTAAAGETLSALAFRYLLPAPLLRAANPALEVGADEPLPAGLELFIPPGDGKIVRVQAGQDALSVALSYGVSPSALAQANGLSSLSQLAAGNLLFVPDASAKVQPLATIYLWPLEHAGRVSSGFGPRPLSVAGNTFHGGLDIAAPEGTRVRATSAGRVSVSGWGGAYGYVVYLEHAGGAQTRYAHLQRPGAPVGYTALAGEAIGSVGSSGASTGPHLHFELRFDGGAVDPLPYLSAYAGD